MKSGLDAPAGLTLAPIGRRALWGLTLGVLAVHLAVLSGLDTDGLLSPSAPPVQRPLQARALPAPSLASPEPRPAAPRPSPRPSARPPAVTPTPAAPPHEGAAGGPMASAILPPSPLAEPLARTAAAEVAAPMASEASHSPESVASAPKAANHPGSPATAANAANPATAAQSAQGAVAPTPPASGPASSPWPVRLGPLPPSSLTRYQLTGMDRGLTYYANGELRWQHGPDAYELSLVVKAFLIGSRQWQSIGQIGPQGLQPLKFIDKAKQERAAHIDREGARIVFSGNTQSTEPQAGLQDQLSLYLQLATALSGELGQRPAGTRLEVQTLTARDAQPWTLVSEGEVLLDLDGRSLRTQKWNAQPRGRFDSRLEIWAAADQAWMPVRIRISQFNGSFIDLSMKDRESLPGLPARGGTAQKTTAP